MSVRPKVAVPRRCLPIAVVLVAAALAAGAADRGVAGANAAGSSVALGPVTKHSGCHVHGSLPDHSCTPGARFSNATRTLVCTSGYSRRVRHVSYSEKSAVYADYGIHRHFNGANGEVDHLVPLELGGSNAESNLWPESATKPYGSHQKDRLENALHGQVCAGSLTLAHGQRLIAGDWVAVYRSRFG